MSEEEGEKGIEWKEREGAWLRKDTCGFFFILRYQIQNQTNFFCTRVPLKYSCTGSFLNHADGAASYGKGKSVFGIVE